MNHFEKISLRNFITIRETFETKWRERERQKGEHSRISSNWDGW